MRKTTLSALLVLMIAAVTFAGCGGHHNDKAQPTTATLKILSQGTLASGTHIGGIDLEVVLPAGVTVKATRSSTNPALLTTDRGVVVTSGVATGANTNTIATYVAATTAAPATLTVQVVNPNGFGTGEFVTINCDIASASFPSATDFRVTLVKAVDLNGAAITGLTAGLTADIQ